MDQDPLIKLVRTYRLTKGLAERFRLGEEIFRVVEPKLRFFVFGSLAHGVAEDVHQEALKAVATGLGGFSGGTVQEFWGWCYRIARNKVNDHLRKQSGDRSQPMAPDELARLMELSASASPISPADRLDLDHALQLLRHSKPECYDYLWKHYILGLAYVEIAEEEKLTYDNARMRVGRCLEEAQTLVSQ